MGDLRLESPTTTLADPSRLLDLVTTDSTTLTLNGNYLLASLTASTTAVGTLRTGNAALTGLSGTYGLADRYRTVVPALAPSGDPLRTQPGRLNFNDGRGYVQSRLEYTRQVGGDTLSVSVSSFGSVPFLVDFGGPFTPDRGADIQVNLRAELFELFRGVDLAADTATVAGQLGASAGFLSIGGF